MDRTLKEIQEQVTKSKIAIESEEVSHEVLAYLWDRLDNMQWAINDYVNREFYGREQDPFQ